MQGLVEFDIRVPVDDEGLRANVRSCLARGLPEVGYSGGRADRLTIIANGPSALQALPCEGPTLAVNGSLRLFDEGATWWAGCDPQEHMADFLTDPPRETVYLVASKCHPAVFEALKNRTVVVWHVDDHATWDLLSERDPIRTGVSITIVAFELMSRFGFRRFTTWGWDGCYMDGKDHAVPQAIVPSNIENEVGDQVFNTTTSWALEAQDAWRKLSAADIDIRGGGMIGAVFDFQRAP